MMIRNVRRWLPIALVAPCLLLVTIARAREVSFAERVRAQEAIERVYYAHQVGTSKSFAEAFPHERLENRVRTYLEQSAMLERHWNIRVTGEMLQRELQRMARDSRMPERLRELYGALNDDPVLVQECLARPALVGRLLRDTFEADEQIHAEAREQAERLHAALVEGSIDPRLDHPVRSVSDLAVEDQTMRARFPAGMLEIGPVNAQRSAFVIYVPLEEQPGHLRVVTYSVAKRALEDWWGEAARDIDARDVATTALEGQSFPLPAGQAEPFSPETFCDPDDTWDNGSLEILPFGMAEHTAIWTGSLMIVWGGDTPLWGSQLPGRGLRYDPALDVWSQISTAGAPELRTHHTAVWTGSAMIVWGGMGGAGLLSSGGRYDPTTDSWAPTSSVGAPSARFVHTAVWTGSRMIVWGGSAGSAVNTGGRYDPATDTWAPTATAGVPAARMDHTAVWAGNRMIVWGGYASGATNSGGRYDPTTDTWAATSTVGAPEPRASHTAVWTGSRMIIWGGTGAGSLNSGGRYNPATDSWAPTNTSTAYAMTHHTAVWTGSVMVAWGGGGKGTNTGIRYNPATDSWTPTSLTDAPAPRYLHTAVWTGQEMIVWGGLSPGGSNTGGRYNPTTNSWSPTPIHYGPLAPRGNHTAVWTGNEMIVWGGQDWPTIYGNGARYNPATDSWALISSVHSPQARDRHTAVWTGQLMIVWGGEVGSATYTNTGGRYDPTTDSWLPTSTAGAPQGRPDASAFWTGSRMIVWGGDNWSSGGRYDPTTDTWSPTSLVNAPAGNLHAAVWTGQEMIVWGGTALQNQGRRYDPIADTWTSTSMVGAPLPRQSHSAVWTGSKMIVWGGHWFIPTEVTYNSGGIYDPATDSWTPTATVGAPTPLYSHIAVWTGSRMIVWRGQSDGGRYDPLADSWAPMTLLSAPGGRYCETAVWTGSFMIVWGGCGALGDGGRYALGHAVDDDGDGVSDCAGDCNDGDAHVRPGPEICDGLDNQCPSGAGFGTVDEGCDDDGDGYCDGALTTIGAPPICASGGGDCDDDDASVRFAPSEVALLTVEGQASTLIQFQSQDGTAGASTSYDVVAGDLTELLGSGGYSTAACLGTFADTPAADALSSPTSGHGRYYLLRARNGCGNGTYGDSSLGADPRDALDVTGPCP